MRRGGGGDEWGDEGGERLGEEALPTLLTPCKATKYNYCKSLKPNVVCFGVFHSAYSLHMPHTHAAWLLCFLHPTQILVLSLSFLA